MKLLGHPNLVQFVDFYPDVDYYFLVMELCTGGELFQRIVEKVRAGGGGEGGGEGGGGTCRGPCGLIDVEALRGSFVLCHRKNTRSARHRPSSER